jgi:hypothetical protein
MTKGSRLSLRLGFIVLGRNCRGGWPSWCVLPFVDWRRPDCKNNPTFLPFG